MLNIPWLCFTNGPSKPGSTFVYDMFTEYFKSIIKTYCSEKNISFKILLFIDNISGYLRALMKMYNEVNIVFLPMVQALLFKKYIDDY